MKPATASQLGTRCYPLGLLAEPGGHTIAFVIRFVLFFILIIDLGFDIKETVHLVPPTSLSISARVLSEWTGRQKDAWGYANLLPTF